MSIDVYWSAESLKVRVSFSDRFFRHHRGWWICLACALLRNVGGLIC
jgi:hypothetical protein